MLNSKILALIVVDEKLKMQSQCVLKTKKPEGDWDKVADSTSLAWAPQCSTCGYQPLIFLMMFLAGVCRGPTYCLIRWGIGDLLVGFFEWGCF